MATKNTTTIGNVDLNTGYTYSSIPGSTYNFNDLMSDPYSVGNINLGSLLTGSGLNIGSTSNTNTTYYNTSWGSIQTSQAKVNITGSGIDMESDCDIKIGNRSLKDFIEQMEQRLALLQINPKLESEWQELKELGDRYRQLEKDIKEKMKTWDILTRNDEAEQKAR